MGTLDFNRNEYPTLGVELELQLVDAETYELSSAVDKILREVPEELQTYIKPELMQCYLEINTHVCHSVPQVATDLKRKLALVESITDRIGLKLFWSATHPFSSWRKQQITVNDRYHRLVELMQDIARRLVTFGLHVHVGVDSGDKAILVCERMLRYLPVLLALSSNSPFWEGRNTGLCSNRSKIMESLPTAGLPHHMRNWSEYIWLVNHLVDTGFINSVREIWWDIRPHHNFGTVEIRVCDIPCNLQQVLALTAMVQCMVQTISEEIDEGTYLSHHHPMMVQQNKWRAIRFGSQAGLVRSDDYRQYSVQEWTFQLIDILAPMAEKLGCTDELHLAALLPGQTGTQRQLEIYRRTQSRQQVVKQMIDLNDWHRLEL